MMRPTVREVILSFSYGSEVVLNHFIHRIQEVPGMQNRIRLRGRL